MSGTFFTSRKGTGRNEISTRGSARGPRKPLGDAVSLSVVTPLWQDRPPEENLQVALNADRLGYGELWVGEMATFDAFAFATAAGARASQIAFTLGPLAVSVRTPMNLAVGAASVASLTGREVRLALGASSSVVVEQWHGVARERTATHLAETAQVTRRLLDGEKVDFEGSLVRTHGYRLRLPPPGAHITIAAFRPAAVRAAARHADRMVLNLVTPQAVASLRAQMDEAAAAVGRPAPKLAVWVTCAVDPGEEALQQVMRAAVGYLAAPGYRDMFCEAGFGDVVQLAEKRPHPKELLAAIPTELPRAIGLLGNVDSIRTRLDAYYDAGADEVCLVPATMEDPGGERTLATMKTFADRTAEASK